MTKHAAYSSEDVVAAVAAPAPAGRHFTSFQALKGAPLDCKKHAAVDLSASGAAVVGGGPWFESMKASSPRRAADAEHGDWMVCTVLYSRPRVVSLSLSLSVCTCTRRDRSARASLSVCRRSTRPHWPSSSRCLPPPRGSRS
jgi:hypothetical protein